MFNNRALQVTMVKNDDKTDTPQIDPIDQLEKQAAIIGAHFKNSVKMVGLAVLGYIAADTVRQVIVNNVK